MPKLQTGRIMNSNLFAIDKLGRRGVSVIKKQTPVQQKANSMNWYKQSQKDKADHEMIS